MIHGLRNKLEQQKGQKAQIEMTLSELKNILRDKRRSLIKYEEAREIIREVGLKTQQQLEFHLSGISSLALNAVFNDPYELRVEFVQRRNKTECDLYFVRGDTRIDPLTASGVGAVDIAAFALRTASWSIQIPQSRNVLILDEPFKHLKGREANIRLLDMIKEISNKLNLQIIMVSDERVDKDDIQERADKVFEIGIYNRVSKIKTNKL